MSGISGAGKTTALKGIKNADEYAAIFDTNLPNVKNATRIIEKILASDSNREVIVNYVHRDVIDVFINGVFPRAESEGRIVTVRHHVGYMKSYDTVAELQKIFSGNPRVSFQFIESKDGKQTLVDSFDKLQKPSYTEEEARKTLNDYVQRKYESENLPEHIAQAYLGRDFRPVRPSDSRRNGPGREQNLGQNQEANLTPKTNQSQSPKPGQDFTFTVTLSLQIYPFVAITIIECILEYV